MLTAFNIAKTANEIMTGFFLLLDGIVYWVISILFDLYYSLAGAEIIKNSVYEEIANRFMVIIGVAMLFYLAYALLKALVNPDEITKSTQKIVTNLVISLVLIVIVPTIFTYAFRFQNIIMKDQVIDKIVFGNSSNTLASIGKETAMNFFDAFVVTSDTTAVDDYANWTSLKACVLNNKLSGCKGTEGFRDLVLLKESVVDGNTEYTPIISTLCGVFLAYVIASFCLDLGLRVVKLAFYQIISPIPIMMRIIPEKKSVFDNWVKATVATYMEVFIRLFIMYAVTFLCAKIFQDGIFNLGGGSVNIFGQIIIVLGIIAFAKQAPKLIGDVIGVNSGNIKLGIKDKLATGGAFTAGAILGGGITAGMRNLTHGVGNIKSANGIGNKFKAGLGMIGSAATGTISGAFRGGKSGINAKSTADMKNAASAGAQEAVNKRDKREAYKASHGGSIYGTMLGHAADTGISIKNWATGGTAGILAKTKFEEEFKDSYKEYEAIYENPNYTAMKSQLQQYEALKASGVTTYEGRNVEEAIKQLKGNMLKSRMDSIRNNTQSAAYAMYNISQLARKNPQLANDIGIDVSMAENLELRGNRIVDKSTNREIEAEKLYKMIEGTSLGDVTYDDASKSYINQTTGNAIDFTTIASSQTKDGMSHQKKKASDQLRRDKLSVEYKEAQKKQDNKK